MRREEWWWIIPLGAIFAAGILIVAEPKTNGPGQIAPLPPAHAYSAAQLSTCHADHSVQVRVKPSGGQPKVSVDAPAAQRNAVKQAAVFQGDANSISWGVSDEELTLCAIRVTLTSGVTFSKDLTMSGGQYPAPAGKAFAQLVFVGYYVP
ncbi:MAG TPA: hypothetical protein VMT30_06095 [Candidatus Saccharimonadia bacterium]|nr:hypothetical protein [Candidatus Saccharimonadia bacterium]